MKRYSNEAWNLIKEIRLVEAHPEFRPEFFSDQYDYLEVKNKVTEALGSEDCDYNEVWRDVNYLKSFVGESTV